VEILDLFGEQLNIKLMSYIPQWKAYWKTSFSLVVADFYERCWGNAREWNNKKVDEWNNSFHWGMEK